MAPRSGFEPVAPGRDKPQQGIGPPQPNAVAARAGGTISENGTETSDEETTRARISVALGTATRASKIP